MSKTSQIIIVNPNSEIQSEGFKAGDTVDARIQFNGAALFKSKLTYLEENRHCLLYPEDYFLLD